MPTPEINVRLTADGVQDVINAFRRVQQESKHTKEEVGLLGQAGQQLKELLPLVSIGLVVGKIVELGKESLQSAVGIGRLAEKVGGSVGVLSVLSEAAQDVGTSQEEMGAGLVKLARSQELASNGNAKAKKAFHDLGISMDDVKKKDPSEMFVEISQKLQEIAPGAQRAAVAQALLSKNGAELIPLMDKIGEAGKFEEAEARAKKLGTYLSGDMVADAIKAQESMRDLADITDGMARQFLAGFVPQMTHGMEQFAASVTGDGTAGFKTFGGYVGSVVTGIVDFFIVGGKTIGAILASILDGAATTTAAFSKMVDRIKNGDFKGALAGLKLDTADAFARQGAIWSEYGKQVVHLYTDKPTPLPTTHKPPPTGGSGDGTTEEEKAKALKDRQKLIDAQASYEETVANAELQVQKARDAQQQERDKANYDQALLSLNAYYDARRARINVESDAEQAIIRTKLQAQVSAAAELMGKTEDFVNNLIAQGPKAVEAAAGTSTEALSMLQKIAQTRAQIDESQIQRQTKLTQNEHERSQEEIQATARVLSDRQRLYQLEGDIASARQSALERELLETDQLLKRLGYADAEREAILGRVRKNAEAQNKVDILSQQGGNAFASLDREVSAIQSQAQNGTISELDAQQRIYELEKQRLPQLSDIADRMQGIVDTNREQLASLQPGTDAYNAQLQVVENLQRAADQYTQQVDTLGASLHRTKSFTVELSNQLSTQGMSAALDFFDAIGSGTQTAGEAFADLGKQFEQMIVHMINQMIIYYTLMALVGWIAPNSSFGKSLKASGPFSGMTGHAGGGYTGDGATDKVAGVVHGQEFVFNAQATQRYGRPLLEAMNAGTVKSVAALSTFAGGSGGGSGNAAGDAGKLVEINIDTGGQPAQTSRRQGADGTSILDIVIGQVASNIASGGSVAQSIQSTYGVSRRGIVRG